MKKPPFLPVKSPCPTCRYEMDCAVPAYKGRRKPRPGDFSLCGSCGEILVFTARMEHRLADLNDLLKLSPGVGDQLTTAQKYIRKERPVLAKTSPPA